MAPCAWDTELPLNETLDTLVPFALDHACASGPYAADLVRLLESRDWVGLCAYELDYNLNASPSSVLEARQALGFFTKLETLEIGVDKEAVAFAKFVESERRCQHVNEFFRMRRLGGVSPLPRLERAILAARRKIRRILGKAPRLSDLKLAFGPGATVSIKRTDSNPTAKMAAGFECSADVYASGLLPELLREVPHWGHALDSAWSIDEEGWLVETLSVRLCAGKLAFVPKNAKTYRSIVVEPCLNGFVQSGLGDYIARRLRSVGVDIRNQVLNQELALLGSLFGDLATIDLSSASDLIARELVRALLPEDWYQLLCAFRTSEVSYKGKTIALEKFSSMGNGFTFPLETLIFWALTRSTVGDDGGVVQVYGDDIICPSSSYEEVGWVLEACGFLLNRTKSYSSGPFRESCGCDYYNGINVRPFYQKQLVSSRSLFVLHNWYKRRFDLARAALVLRAIPRELRIYGPDGYGDGHLVSDEYPRQLPAKYRRRGYAGHFFETYTPLVRKFRSPYPGDYVSPLYSLYVREPQPLLDWDELPLSEADGSAHGDPMEAPQGYSSGRPGERPTWPLPGVLGYRKTLIYTLG